MLNPAITMAGLVDLEEKDPAKRFKSFVTQSTPQGWAIFVHLSPDGIHWGDPAAVSAPVGDRLDPPRPDLMVTPQLHAKVPKVS